VTAAEKHYTVIVSLDGCRADYAEWYHTPFFDYMATHGVKANMMPSFPSKTFPNHYTLATGLYPDHHGIVANTFMDTSTGKVFDLGNPETKYDAKFYGGEPIWLTAQKQGVRTAVVYWPGSDVPVMGKYPESYLKYDSLPRLSLPERINRVVEMLSQAPQKCPSLVMLYMEQPDGNGHTYGPEGKETQKAVVYVDSLMKVLWQKLQALPIAPSINFIVTSDHGMTATSPERTIPVKKYLKKNWIKAIYGNLPGQIYTADNCTDSVVNALRHIPHLKVWKREDIPSYLHYGSNAMIGDVVALPDLGWLFTDSQIRAGGTHGYDPTYNDMHAIFRAIGPDFKEGYTKQAYFRNVDIYPLLAHLLSIKPAKNDGDVSEVIDMLTTHK
jgi:predicted AlkP superfamily pyrophosphatase or phosphodiesterase